MSRKEFIKRIVYGCAIGDALGVPFEFKKKDSFVCTDMIGFGTHHQECGTWSDDTSLLLCLAMQLAEGYSITELSKKFLDWLDNDCFTANGSVFDIGIATHDALIRLKNGISPHESGLDGFYNNGNGSLMRVAPLCVLLKDFDYDERYKICKEVSCITHAHEISIFACLFLVEMSIEIINGCNLYNSYKNTIDKFNKIYKCKFSEDTFKVYNKTMNDVSLYDENCFNGNGYVVNSLETCIKCLLSTSSYKDAVLKAVNYGDDTDTTAAITGSVACLYYGMTSIPEDWILKLKNKKLLDKIINMY